MRRPLVLLTLPPALLLTSVACSEAGDGSGSGGETGATGSVGTGGDASNSGGSNSGGAPNPAGGGGGEVTGGGGDPAPGGGGSSSGGGTGGGNDGTGGDGGDPAPGVFREVDGLVVIEAENFLETTSAFLTGWHTFEEGTPELTECPAMSTCPGSPTGNCNPYDDCDDDHHDAAVQSGGAYVEVLPNRRRTDHEAGTGSIGVSNSPASSPQLWYEVEFTSSGVFYAWARGYGKGPADNGLWLGLTDSEEIAAADFSPDYGLPDYAGLRFQFKNGWQWQNCRRGESQHTGVNGCDVEDNMRIEIPAPGRYFIVLAMREDGVDVDKLYFSKSTTAPTGLGPDETR